MFYLVCRIRTELYIKNKKYKEYKDKKVSSKRTYDFTDYDKDVWVIYYSSMNEVVLFDKTIKESCII